MIVEIYTKSKELVLKYAILILLFFYCIIAVGSGLKGGVLMGIGSITFLYFAYKFDKHSYILVFYIFTYFFGLFKLMYMEGTFLFDMTFLLSNILLIHYFVKKQKIFKYYFYLYVLLIISIVLNLYEHNDMYYQTFSLFNYFLVFGILLYLNKDVSLQVGNIIVLISSLLVFFSLLQMFGFLGSVVESAQGAKFNILGFDLNRPSGVSGGIYKAGTKVFIALYLIYRYLPSSSFNQVFKRYKYFWYLVVVLAILSGILSQRSLLLGMVILIPIVFMYKMKVNKKIKNFLIILITILGLIVLPFTVYYLDASNAMKFFMWIDVWNNIRDSNFVNLMFGHGPFNVAYTLMGKDYGALAQVYSIEGWDIAEIGTPKLPHNIYIQALYDHGVLYLGIYLLLIYKSINIYFSKSNTSNNILFYLTIVLFINFALHNGIMNISIALLFLYLKEKNDVVLKRQNIW